MSDEVRKISAHFEQMARSHSMIDALMGGTQATRNAKGSLLPQWPAEDDEAYTARINSSFLFPAFQRTIEVLNSKPFSRPITLTKETPEAISGWCENIDLQGANLHSFAASVGEEMLSKGFCGILVDCPTVNKDGSQKLSKADEKKLGVRPYFVLIKAGSFLGYRSVRIGGVETLTQLRFLETVTEEDGEFGEKQIEQVRVLGIGKWSVYRKTKDTTMKETWALYDEGVTTLNQIPFVPCYGKRTGFMSGIPPLLELAYLNIEHWQSSSDQRTIMHVARVPLLFAKCFGDNDITVGASSAVVSGNPEADLRYVEHSGKAIEAGRQDLIDIEDRMRQVGAELLVIKGKQTVAQTVSDNESGKCALQRITEELENALNNALKIAAEWVKQSSKGKCNVFKDFGAASLAEASADLLLQMNVAGTLSNESLFSEMKRRGIISDDLEWVAEEKRIKSQLPKKGDTVLTA